MSPPMDCVRVAAQEAGISVPAFERVDPRYGISNRKVVHHLLARGWDIPTGRWVDLRFPCLVQFRPTAPGRLAHLQYFVKDDLPKDLSNVWWVAFPPDGVGVTRSR